MAIAVINHADLVQFTDDLGFPKYTKVQLCVGGIGHQYYDRYVREHVSWINEIDFDPLTQVRITESAQLVGEIPESWSLRHQQYLEGDVDHNAFKELDEGFGTHVNRNAIRLATGNALLKYRVDYVTIDGVIANENSLAVAVFDSAEDTSLSYTTNLPVDVIWTTKVELLSSDDGIDTPHLFKRAYYNDPVKEESHPWIYEGRLTDEEYEIWKLHNVRPEEDLNWANVDFRDIQDEAVKRVTATDLIPLGVKGIAHLAR